MAPNDEAEIKKLAQDDKPVRQPRRIRRSKGLGGRVIHMGYTKSLVAHYTKATHSIKKERAKNAKTKQQRTREIARARKARKESYSQVS